MSGHAVNTQLDELLLLASSNVYAVFIKCCEFLSLFVQSVFNIAVHVDTTVELLRKC